MMNSVNFFLLAVCLFLAGFISSVAGAQDADAFKHAFGQATIQPIISDDITRGEILTQLRERCARAAASAGGKLVWRVDPQPALDQERFFVRVAGIPLRNALETICTMFDLQVRYGAISLSIGDRGDPLAPLMARKFHVLPGFWKAIRMNAPWLGEEQKLTPRDVKLFFKNLGIDFPAGADVEDVADSPTLVVRNTEENLKKLETFLLKTYLKPYRMDIGVHLASCGDQLRRNVFVVDKTPETPQAWQKDFFPRVKLMPLAGGFVDVARQRPGQEIQYTFQLADGTPGNMVFTITKARILEGCRGADIELEVNVSVKDLGYEWSHASALTLGASSVLPLNLPPLQLSGGKTENLQVVISNLFVPRRNAVSADTKRGEQQTDQVMEVLRTVILPRIDYEEEPLLNVLTQVAELGRLQDPSGKGVPINVLLPAAPPKPPEAIPPVAGFDFPDEDWGDEDWPGPALKDPPYTVTIAATDIPLGDALRFITESAKCDYVCFEGSWATEYPMVSANDVVDPSGAWIVHPAFSPRKKAWKIFSVPKGSFESVTQEPADWGGDEMHDNWGGNPHVGFAAMEKFFSRLGVDIGNNGWIRRFSLPRGELLAAYCSAENLKVIGQFLSGSDDTLCFTRHVRTKLRGWAIPPEKLETIFPDLKGIFVEGCQAELDARVGDLASGTLFDIELLGLEGRPATLAFQTRLGGKEVTISLCREAELDEDMVWLGESDTSLQISIAGGDDVSWQSQRAWTSDTSQFTRLGNWTGANPGKERKSCLLVRERNSLLSGEGTLSGRGCGAECDPQAGICVGEKRPSCGRGADQDATTGLSGSTGRDRSPRKSNAVTEGSVERLEEEKKGNGCPHHQVRVFNVMDMLGMGGVRSCALYLQEPWLIRDARTISTGTKIWTRGHVRALDGMGEFFHSLSMREPVQYRLSLRRNNQNGWIDYFIPLADGPSASLELKPEYPGMDRLSFFIEGHVRGRQMRIYSFSGGKHVATDVLETGRELHIPELEVSFQLAVQNALPEASGPNLENLLTEHNRKRLERRKSVDVFCRQLNQTPLPAFKLEKTRLNEAIEHVLNASVEPGRKIQYIYPSDPWFFTGQKEQFNGGIVPLGDWGERPTHVCNVEEKEGVALLLDRLNVSYGSSDLVRDIVIHHRYPETSDFSGKTPGEVLCELRRLYRCRMEVVDDTLCILPILDLSMQVMPVRQEFFHELVSRCNKGGRSSSGRQKILGEILTEWGIDKQHHDYLWLLEPSKEILAAGSEDFLKSLDTFFEADIKRNAQ